MLRASAAIAPALTVATMLQYVLQVVAAKRLPAGDFGAFGALLALTVVGAVPLFAVQAITARRVASEGARDDGGTSLGMLGPALRCGLAVGAVAAMLAIPIALFLHVPLVAALMLAAALVPLPVVGAALGAAQGERRHLHFVLLYLAFSASRLLFVIPALWLHPTTTFAMGGVALGSAATGVAASTMLRRGDAAAPEVGQGLGREVLLTSLALLAVLALTSTDLLLARHRLPAADSDLYALGSLGARAVFWLLQFAGVAAYAELASHTSAARRQTTLMTGLGVVLMLGAVGTAIVAWLPEQVVTAMSRPEYAAAVPVLPLFAALGTLLAAAQYLLMAGVARGRQRGGAILATAAVTEAVVLWLVPTPTVARIALIATALTALATLGLLTAALRLVEIDHADQDAGLPGQGGGR